MTCKHAGTPLLVALQPQQVVWPVGEMIRHSRFFLPKSKYMLKHSIFQGQVYCQVRHVLLSLSSTKCLGLGYMRLRLGYMRSKAEVRVRTGTTINKVLQNYPATDGDQYVAMRQRNALEGLFNKYGVDVGAAIAGYFKLPLITTMYL